MKHLLLVITILFSTFCFAQNDKEQIKNTVENFFTAMRDANSNALKNTFSETIVFQTVARDGTVKTEDVQQFADGISKYAIGDLDEQITIKKILTDGQLASVWMDYKFLFKGKVSHCGVNSFQLVKINSNWKVQYIIDTRRKCD